MGTSLLGYVEFTPDTQVCCGEFLEALASVLLTHPLYVYARFVGYFCPALDYCAVRTLKHRGTALIILFSNLPVPRVRASG